MKSSNLPAWAAHARAFGLGLLAVAVALFAERIVRDEREAGVPAATLWYAIAIVLFVLAIWGTYYRRTMLPIRTTGRRDEPTPAASGVSAAPRPAATEDRTPLPVRRAEDPGVAQDLEGASRSGLLRTIAPPRLPVAIGVLRWLLTGLALVLGFVGVQTLRQDWLSAPGTLLFVGSVALLILAWSFEKVEQWPEETAFPAAQHDAEVSTDWRLPGRVQVLYVALVCVIALALRVYGLGNLQWGMHGDEGEAATDAIAIMNGNFVSPFTTGWFSQPNFYYWSIAIGMKIFGFDVFGLRMSTVVFSMLGFPFFYLLVRRMFGVRAAVIALALLATNAMFLHYSRPQLSLITTPVFWTIGFYFLFRGLRTRRMLDFVLGAYASFFSLYFYFGARILPFMLAGYLVYMVLFQRHFLRRYWRHLLVFVIATLVITAPFLGYYVDHTQEINARSAEKFIYNNLGAMQGMYGSPPPIALPGGAEVTLPDNAYYFWRQFTLTMSMFFYRPAGDSFYDFTREPVVNFLESALLVLGLAMAAWRWRDTRFAFLLVWFWAPVIAGGVLTVEAPYTPRIAGMFPTLAIFFTLIINKLGAEWVALWRAIHRPLPAVRFAPAAGLVLVVALTLGLAMRNVTDYYGRFVWNYWVAHAAAQAYFVEQNGPRYKYYEIGVPFQLDFNNGGIRFVRQSMNIDGRDMFNIGSSIPFQDSHDKDVMFIVNNGMEPQLAAVRQYYPEGVAEPYFFAPHINTFTSYRIPKEAVAARQHVTAAYGPIPTVRPVPGIGTAYAPPPEGASYPLAAKWSGALFAPGYATYGFKLTAPEGSTLKIDGRVVLTASVQAAAEQEVVLARGLHEFALDATLAAPGQEVSLLWRAGQEPWSEPSGAYLWNGPAGGLLGEIYPLRADAVIGGLEVELGGDGSSSEPYERRVDNVIDWRRPGEGLGNNSPSTARWRGKYIAPTDGSYLFSTQSFSDSGVWIDGRQVVRNVSVAGIQEVGGVAELSAGEHDIEIRYNWSGGHAVMVLYVTPPGGGRVVANGTMFGRAPAAWLPGEVPAPPAGTVALTDLPELTDATRLLRLDGLGMPRGLVVDEAGNFYVADRASQRIQVYDPQGKQLGSWGAPGEGQGQFSTITDLARGPGGELYAADHDLGRVTVFDRQGNLLRTIGAAQAPLSAPNGLAVAPDGYLYVANTAGSNVLRMAPDGSAVTVLEGGPPGSPRHFDQPLDVLVTRDGSVYVADMKNRIVRLDAQGSWAEEYSIPIARYEDGAKLAQLGAHIFVSNPDTGQLARLDPAAGAVITFDTGRLRIPLASPSGIAAREDELYVLDRLTRQLHVFDQPR